MKRIERLALERKAAVRRIGVVVPVFEALADVQVKGLSKKDLLQLMEDGTVLPFHFTHWKKGQKPTNYSKWALARTAYQVRYQEYYEPFLMISKPFPAFDERFDSGYFDKSSHVYTMSKLPMATFATPKPEIQGETSDSIPTLCPI
eukprot:1393516-Amorphochlora_amoeboformis.AAC.2